jgi:hypothetical protein
MDCWSHSLHISNLYGFPFWRVELLIAPTTISPIIVIPIQAAIIINWDGIRICLGKDRDEQGSEVACNFIVGRSSDVSDSSRKKSVAVHL